MPAIVKIHFTDKNRSKYTQHFGLDRNFILIEQCHSIAIVPWCVQLVSNLLVWCHRNDGKKKDNILPFESLARNNSFRDVVIVLVMFE